MKMIPFASLHINEAHKRLTGVCEWYKKAEEMLPRKDDDEDDMVTDVLIH